eukprot:scaffold7351_cov28-Tisochrysis_lutea.AAC.2
MPCAGAMASPAWLATSTQRLGRRSMARSAGRLAQPHQMSRERRAAGSPHYRLQRRPRRELPCTHNMRYAMRRSRLRR